MTRAIVLAVCLKTVWHAGRGIPIIRVYTMGKVLRRGHCGNARRLADRAREENWDGGADAVGGQRSALQIGTAAPSRSDTTTI